MGSVNVRADFVKKRIQKSFEVSKVVSHILITVRSLCQGEKD